MRFERLTRNGSGRLMHAIVLSLFCALAAIAAPAQTFTSLFSFDYTNGEGPGSLVRGLDGNFYGVTWAGGKYGYGIIFRITPQGALTDVYDFCSQYRCLKGANPQLLMLGKDGSFYGTTSSGGSDSNCNLGAGCGVIFKFTSRGVFTVLHALSLSEGSSPNALIQGIDGNFYGTASGGGSNGYGSVFQLTPAGQLTVLHNFCSLSNCVDGSFPVGQLVQTQDGTLYGLAGSGGAQNHGTIYTVAADGTFSTVHNFIGTDGSSPVALIQGSGANFYGVTSSGGVNGWGTIFRLSTAGELTTLYSFCSQVGCPDGTSPGTLLLATDKNLYVAAALGPSVKCDGWAFGCGTLDEFTSEGVLIRLHTFDGTDGNNPNALLQDTDGSFYGSALGGGNMNIVQCTGDGGCGTIFNLSTGLAPFVTLTRNSGRAGESGEILGRGFRGTTGVFLNGTPASFTVLSDTVIQATVPAGATSGFVTVQTPSGTLSSNVKFQVVP